MKKANYIAVVIAAGMSLIPCMAIAQEAANQPASTPVAATNVPADQQATKVQVAKMFELMRLHEQMASVTKMMPALMRQQFNEQAKQALKDHTEGASMTEEQEQATEKIMNKFMGKVVDLYTSDEMMDEMGSVYQKHLTRSDADGIITFYSSPAGQHMLDMMPVIMQEFMPSMMQKMQERMKPLIEEMSKEMEAIRKPATPCIDKPVTPCADKQAAK
jgi:hypothetical protein